MIKSRIVLRWHEDLAIVANLVLIGIRVGVVRLLDCVVLAAYIIEVAGLVFHDDAIQLLEIRNMV